MNNRIPIENLKDGDFLVKGGWIFIFDHFEPGQLNRNYNTFLYKALMNIGRVYVKIPRAPSRGIGYYEESTTLRYATNKERKEMITALEVKGYTYNEETKRVEKIQ